MVRESGAHGNRAKEQQAVVEEKAGEGLEVGAASNVSSVARQVNFLIILWMFKFYIYAFIRTYNAITPISVAWITQEGHYANSCPSASGGGFVGGTKKAGRGSALKRPYAGGTGDDEEGGGKRARKCGICHQPGAIKSVWRQTMCRGNLLIIQAYLRLNTAMCIYHYWQSTKCQ